jgi:hypothetical protein
VSCWWEFSNLVVSLDVRICLCPGNFVVSIVDFVIRMRVRKLKVDSGRRDRGE